MIIEQNYDWKNDWKLKWVSFLCMSIDIYLFSDCVMIFWVNPFYWTLKYFIKASFFIKVRMALYDHFYKFY